MTLYNNKVYNIKQIMRHGMSFMYIFTHEGKLYIKVVFI